ncbi:MAG: hypothetical protein IT305_26595 [Chloroflexi bacterium]|nr:hypothetical protein [Chloroflexota bacterium]
MSGAGGGTLVRAASQVIQGSLPPATTRSSRPSVTPLAVTLATTCGDRLEGTVVASALTPPTGNRLREVNFSPMRNARVTVDGQTIASGQGIALPEQPAALPFTVRRATLGQPALASFTAVDARGPWSSYAGGGVDAGFSGVVAPPFGPGRPSPPAVLRHPGCARTPGAGGRRRRRGSLPPGVSW